MLAPALKRLELHAAREEDLAAIFRLISAEREKNPWIERSAELVREAIDSPKGEYRVCVAERDSEIIGFGVYGLVAGAIGTGIVHSILVAPRSRRAGIGLRVIFHIAAELASQGARILVAEIPAEPSVMRFRALLISYGFVEETRIDDYYRDGVPQIVSRFDL